MAITSSATSAYTSNMRKTSCAASSWVECAVWPSCQRNSVVRRNMRVRSSQRMMLAHWFTSIGRSRQLLIHLAKKWPMMVSDVGRMTYGSNIAGAATALALGPNALLYVSAPNQILEINPVSLAPTPGGVVAVDATPGKLVFTPDGNYAVAANQTFGTQPAILLLNLNDHLIEGTVPFTGLTTLATSPLP